MEGKQFQRTEDGHLILMSTDERDLLITDLTARINYGVICLIERVDDFGPRFRDEKLTGFCYDEMGYFYFQFAGGLDVEFAEKVKPYLRPMLSMTEEERDEFMRVDCGFNRYVWAHTERITDWLNKHMFDYRGLIEMGLAISAPKDMYEISYNTTGNE